MDLEASEPTFGPTRQSERVFFNNISKERASLEEKEPSMAKESEKQSEICVEDSDSDSDSDLEASEPAFAHLQQSERLLCSNMMKEHAVLEEKGHKEVEKPPKRQKTSVKPTKSKVKSTEKASNSSNNNTIIYNKEGKVM